MNWCCGGSDEVVEKVELTDLKSIFQPTLLDDSASHHQFMMQAGGATSSTHKIHFKRSFGDHLGVDLEVVDEITCVVTMVKQDGLIPDWNATATTADVVRTYDRIIQVATSTGEGQELSKSGRKIAEALQTCSGTVAVLLQRPQVKVFNICRNGQSLGLHLSFSEAGSSILVKDVDEAFQSAVTKSSPEGSRMEPNDRIVRVNGSTAIPITVIGSVAAGRASANAAALVALMRQEEFSLTVCSYVDAQPNR
mmetsp:Transcript_74104/g.131041  ORF Transcript_74104/g.131041 Transcript_74104/m.131041 type:complete len:251 (-) Transcript_74104:58-810(-)